MKNLDAPADQRFGLRQPVGGHQQLGEVAQVDGDIRVVGSIAGFVDGHGPTHQWFDLPQPVGGHQQLGETAQPEATSGWSGPLASSMAKATRINGSASRNRSVAINSWARLLRWMATRELSDP